MNNGYRFLKETDGYNLLEEPPDYEQGLWNKIWSLESSNKVKHLIWRVCKNSLSTKGNLVVVTYKVMPLVIAALLPLRTIYTQFGVVQVWTVFGKLRRHGIFVKRSFSRTLGNLWPGLKKRKNSQSCLRLPSGQYGHGGINFGNSKHVAR